MRKHCLTLIISVCGLALNATGDSLHYLTPKDTLFVQVFDSGKKFFEHNLEKGQTLYSLAGFYGLKLPALLYFNSGLNPEGPFVKGQTIRIPLPDSALVIEKNGTFDSRQYAPVFYQVKAGETLYRIAKVYFKVPIETVKANNSMPNENLKTGQMLHIGWLSTEGIPDSLQHFNSDSNSSNLADLIVAFQNAAANGKVESQRGAAYWHRERKNEREFLARHRYAPIGSVIQIINPMKKKVSYARVVGTISDRIHGADIIVVLSVPVAKHLETKDSRFFVELRYIK